MPPDNSVRMSSIFSAVSESTLNLLLGYYEPQSGEILINDSNAFCVKQLNEKIAIMRQDPVLFNDTLRNNLTMYGLYVGCGRSVKGLSCDMPRPCGYGSHAAFRAVMHLSEAPLQRLFSCPRKNDA